MNEPHVRMAEDTLDCSLDGLGETSEHALSLLLALCICLALVKKVRVWLQVRAWEQRLSKVKPMIF